MYVCMYVTMILPIHFSVPIYSPWQKKKKKKNSHKIKRGAGPLPGPEPHSNFAKVTFFDLRLLEICPFQGRFICRSRHYFD